MSWHAPCRCWEAACSLDVVDDAPALYLQAARKTLRGSGAGPEQFNDIDDLLRRLDNDWDRAESAAGRAAGQSRTLAARAAARASEELAERIDRAWPASSARHCDARWSRCRPAFARKPRHWLVPVRSIVMLATCAMVRGEAGWMNESAGAEHSLLTCWQAVASLALTGEGEWRKAIDKRRDSRGRQGPQARWTRGARCRIPAWTRCWDPSPACLRRMSMPRSARRWRHWRACCCRPPRS